MDHFYCGWCKKKGCHTFETASFLFYFLMAVTICPSIFVMLSNICLKAG